MKLSSKFLIDVVIGAGGGCVIALTSIAAGAETINPYPLISPQVVQIPLQSRQSGNALARVSLRITQLENEIRRLTGQNEELTHRLGQLEELLKYSTNDTALRLKTLEGRGGSAGAPGMAATVPTGASTASVSGAAPRMARTTTVSGADKGAKVLGTPANCANASSSQARCTPPWGVTCPLSSTSSASVEKMTIRPTATNFARRGMPRPAR